MILPSAKEDSAYFDLLSGSVSEKSQIKSYFHLYPDGVFMDVGIGGGEVVLEMVSEIERLKKLHPEYVQKIIAADTSSGALESLYSRFPQISTLPFVEILKANATNTGLLPASISAINASDLIHEIGSYGEGIKSIKEFIKEVDRILAIDGVLVVRDPESVNISKKVEVVLETLEIRRFFLFFIGRYVRKQLLDNLPWSYYDLNKQTLVVFNKNKEQLVLTLSEFLSYNKEIIDFNLPIKIIGDLGIVMEVAKHFITFAYISPELLSYVDEAGNNMLNTWYAESNTLLSSLFNREIKVNEQLNDKELQLRNRCLDELLSFIPEGINVSSSKSDYETKVKPLLLNYKIAHKTVSNDFDVLVNINSFQFNYYFDEFMKLLSANILTLDLNNEKFLSWSSRENGESYFYGDSSELIAWFAEESFSPKDNVFLCPISPDLNVFVERKEYTNLINHHFSGLEFRKEGKRIIHFNKVNLEEGLHKLEIIYHNAPHPELLKVINMLKLYA